MRSPPHRPIRIDGPGQGWGKLDALLREHYPRVFATHPHPSCFYCDPLCTNPEVCPECADLLTGLGLVKTLPAHVKG